MMSKRLKLSSQFHPPEVTATDPLGIPSVDQPMEGTEDRISQLPDDILMTILSRLALRVAARTSIISHRWKTLWTFTTGNLDFVAPVACREGNLPPLQEQRKKYCTWVNKVTKSHKGATIDGFKVCFDLDKTYKSDVDSWIDFAIEKKSTRLEVELKGMFHKDVMDLYPFPKEVLGFSNIKFLRALRLCTVDVSGPVLEDILLKCPSLEALSVSWSGTLLGLKVCGPPSLKLKFVEIRTCNKLEYIEVSAGNLMSLVYIGPFTTKIRIRHAPKLECIRLGGVDCFPLFPMLSPVFSQITTLVLDCMTGDIWDILYPEFPEFKILKRLELKVETVDEESSLSCISLIKACPMLHRLGVEIIWLSNEHKPRKMKTIEGAKFKCLKVVEFIRFAGRTSDVELAIALLENAPYVEKIIFDPRNPYSGLELERNPLEKKPLPLDDFDAARECARQLAKKHSPEANLVVL